MSGTAIKDNLRPFPTVVITGPKNYKTMNNESDIVYVVQFSPIKIHILAKIQPIQTMLFAHNAGQSF